jgi:hypothetical protein
MPECCCATTIKYTPTLGDYVRNAIEVDNFNFFEDYVRKKTQAGLANVRINDTYTIIEYTIIRNKLDLLEYFLDDQKFGLNILNQERGKELNKAIEKLCSSVQEKQALLKVESARRILTALSKKSINTERYNEILDTSPEEDKKCVLS